MVTHERYARLKQKRFARKCRNEAAKAQRAEARRLAMIELGKTVIVTVDDEGVKHYAFPPKQKEPPSVPGLAWLGGKQYRHPDPRKCRSGYKPEHTEAIIEDASRSLAKEIDKALAPEEVIDAVETA